MDITIQITSYKVSYITWSEDPFIPFSSVHLDKVARPPCKEIKLSGFISVYLC